MPKKRKSTKRVYNPKKAANTLLRNKASKCILFRWVNATEEYGEFDSHGPYDNEQVAALMGWALLKPESWSCMVVACFEDGRTDYYEEVLELPPIGPTTLSKDAVMVDSQVLAAIAEAKKGGNPNHYIDTAVIMQLHNERQEDAWNDDDFLKQQARHRSMLLQTSNGYDEVSPIQG